jgi:RHS repeat-associated protein
MSVFPATSSRMTLKRGLFLDNLQSGAFLTVIGARKQRGACEKCVPRRSRRSFSCMIGQGEGTVLWGLGDHEGTIRDIVNNSGTVVDHRKYDSFGKMTSESTPTTDFIFGYTGQALDKAVGLYNYGHRWYDPATGRFASEDPSGFAAGDANLYRYVGNDPLNNTDPTGLCSSGNSSSFLGALGSAVGSAVSSCVQPYVNATTDLWSNVRPDIVQPIVSTVDYGLGMASGFTSTASQTYLSEAPLWMSAAPIVPTTVPMETEFYKTQTQDPRCNAGFWEGMRMSLFPTDQESA